MSQLYTNNAESVLAVAIASTDVVPMNVQVTAGHGDRFPVIATVGNDYFDVTLENAAGVNEIFRIKQRTSGSDVLVVDSRAREGTVARNWTTSPTTVVGLRVTAGALEAMSRKTDVETLTNKTLNGSFCATPTAGDNTTKLSNTAFVADAITTAVAAAVAATKQALYPVGSIYTNASNATNPATLLGFGTWVAFGAGRMMVGIDPADPSFDLAEEVGGSKNATLVSHTHTFTGSGSTGAAGGHGHTINDPGHTHTTNTVGGNVAYGAGTSAPLTSNGAQSGAAGTGISINAAADHTHTVSVSGSNSTEGASAVNANLPPYIVVYAWKRTA